MKEINLFSPQDTIESQSHFPHLITSIYLLKKAAPADTVFPFVCAATLSTCFHAPGSCSCKGFWLLSTGRLFAPGRKTFQLKTPLMSAVSCLDISRLHKQWIGKERGYRGLMESSLKCDRVEHALFVAYREAPEPS